jgi:hypothetical protein
MRDGVPDAELAAQAQLKVAKVPVAYKARAIGQNLLHGTPVPGNAYF